MSKLREKMSSAVVKSATRARTTVRPTTAMPTNHQALRPTKRTRRTSPHPGTLGDAAHPTTPNLGQGACMAIDDAMLLGELLATRPPLEAFATYELTRMAPTSSIVGLSWAAGKLGQWRAPLAVRARELLHRVVPRAVFSRAIESQLRRSVPRACGV